jgi:Asp-tRNA(Asn)/Glu-tRNA(Gln) amidotransferase A subunit family amidase
VCAFKPTYGRISVAGVQPLAPSLDHIGVMANCVWDLAAVFQLVAGDDFRDHTAATLPVPDCTRRVDKELAQEAPVRTTFDVPSTFFEPKLSSEVSAFMGRVTADVKSLTYLQGWYHAVALPAQFHDVHRLHRLLMAVEAAQTHAERLERHPGDYPARITELVQDGLRTNAVDYRQARLDRDDLEGQCQNLCAPTPLLMPATLDVPPVADTTGDPWCNSPWSFLGFPVVTVPAGWSNGGLPLGVQIIDANWNEEHLLARAAHLERAFRDENPICPRRLPPVPE